MSEIAGGRQSLPARSPRGSPGPVRHDSCAGELALAEACARGDPSALAEFEARYLSEIDKHIARVDPSREFADEVRQLLRVKLFVASAGAPPKITGYTGRGPLGAWLRVVALRTARDLVAARPGRREVPDGGSQVIGNSNPEIAYLRNRYGAELTAALQELLAALPPRDRNVLNLYFREGLSSTAIGAIYGVTGATVRLWIKRCRESLLASSCRLLSDRLGLAHQEIASVVAMVRSQIDLSLSRVLEARGLGEPR